MAFLKGLDNTTNIEFNNLTSDPEYLTNVHSVIFDDKQYGYEGDNFTKLVNSTSIEWNGAMMPNTARYLNLDEICVHNTTELLDIIERIAIKIHNGKKASDIDIELLEDGSNRILKVTPSQTGVMTIIFPAGLNYGTEVFNCTGGVTVEYTLINTITTDIRDIIKISLDPEDDEYSSCEKNIEINIPCITVSYIRWNINDEEGWSTTININQTPQWPDVIIAKSNNTTETKTVDGTNVLIRRDEFKNDIEGIYSSIHSYYNNIPSENTVNVTVINPDAIPYNIVIQGKPNITIQNPETPVTTYYTAYTVNRNNVPLNNVTDDCTFEITEVSDGMQFTQIGNQITFNNEGSLTLYASYEYEDLQLSNYIIIDVNEIQQYYWTITTSSDNLYITNTNYKDISTRTDYNGLPLNQIITQSFTGNGEYLYIVMPAGINITVRDNNNYEYNMYTYNGEYFVRNTNATVDNGTYKIYRSSGLIYGELKISIEGRPEV